MAEFVLKDRVKKAGLEDKFFIASADTSTEENGYTVHPGTVRRLAREGIPAGRCQLILDSHANLLRYVQPGRADGVVFHFGWLPGADHAVHSEAGTSIPAMEAALTALRPGGILSAVLYAGAVIGDGEKQAARAWLESLPLTRYTVLVCRFANWADTAPLPCFVIKK